MSQDSKEWIKTRMASLKRQAGFAFNQDLFISILLCLISGRDKHLILTAPLDRLNEVSQMASQISRGLFGLTTAKMNCEESRTRADLIETLFNTREESEASTTLNKQQQQQQQHESPSHKASKPIQILDSRTSERSQTNHFGGQQTSFSKSTTTGDGGIDGIKFSNTQQETDNIESHKSPISPVDFNLRKRDKPSFILNNRTSITSSVATLDHVNLLPQQQQREYKRRFSRDRWSDHEDMKRLPPIVSGTTATTKIAQTVIMQTFDSANESIQALLLELIVTKELRISNVKYNVPKPFLVIAVLPQGYDRLAITSQLMDRFFVSYNFDQDMFGQSPIPNTPRQPTPRRIAFIKQDEIKGLAEKALKVHVNIDVMRYIRDIVVGVRTHPRVKGGITARCSQDLVIVTKSLATLFMRDYLTPDLVAIAAEKVFSHRLHVLALNTHDDQMEKEDMDANLPSNIVSEILRIIYVPV